MKAESIFFYMTATGLLLVPVAWAMTDFRSRPIAVGLPGALARGRRPGPQRGGLRCSWSTRFRHGKAIVVSPLVNAGGPARHHPAVARHPPGGPLRDPGRRHGRGHPGDDADGRGGRGGELTFAAVAYWTPLHFPETAADVSLSVRHSCQVCAGMPSSTTA